MNLFLILLGGLVVAVVAPPPQRVQAEHEAAKEKEGQNPNADNKDDGHRPMYEFTYSKYLEEVVKILESEPKFSEKLRAMPEADIKAGKIADHIDDLGDHVFDKLTRAKLDELERLREQIQKQIEAEGGAHNVKVPEHLDTANWEKFSKEDLRKLIRKTVEDMDAIDRDRQKNFKEYEMKKRAEMDHKLAQMNEEERKKAEHEAEESKKRHAQHEKLKHPGSRDQLEEVWEDTDHMDKDNFDPRTFFALHDLNGDGFWNAEELEALFQKELEKMYNETDPDDDPRERMEEMYRMREHVTKQMDKNHDRLISLDEFLQDTEAQTPNKDPGWKDIGDQDIYTDEELQQFEKEYAQKQVPTTQPQPQQVRHDQPPQYAQQPVQNVAQPAQPQAAVPNAQPVHQQHAQPVQQQQQQQVPIHHEPIVDKPKDPAYGI
ncbi:hypothetical protein Q1695_001476 [Nippostrongylus brasiliensis]|nr:hypothetical protein Q1695_001476 [Nippostrongylus brasiliensis]